MPKEDYPFDENSLDLEQEKSFSLLQTKGSACNFGGIMGSTTCHLKSNFLKPKIQQSPPLYTAIPQTCVKVGRVWALRLPVVTTQTSAFVNFHV